jgi:hypothetical protein
VSRTCLIISGVTQFISGVGGGGWGVYSNLVWDLSFKINGRYGIRVGCRALQIDCLPALYTIYIDKLYVLADIAAISINARVFL